jgi:hypothetical protein
MREIKDSDKPQYGHQSVTENKVEKSRSNILVHEKEGGEMGSSLKRRVLNRRNKKWMRRRKADWRLLLHSYMTTLFDPTYDGKLPLALYNATSSRYIRDYIIAICL